MGRWMVKAAELLTPLLNLLREELVSSGYIQCAETPVQVLKEPGKKATSKSYMWVQARAGPGQDPIVLFDYDPTRSGQVPERLLWRFLHLASRRLDCPAFGLIAGQRARLENLGTFGIRLRQSLTLFDLLTRFERAVSQVSSHARFWTERSEGTTWFCREGMREIVGFESGRAEAEHWTLMFMLHLVGLAAGPTWQPSRIILQCERTRALTQASAFSGVDLCFDQHVTAIALPPELFARPLRPATPRSDVVSELRDRLRPLLRDGHPDLPTAAEIAGMSPRSLQRRLNAEGLTYASLVDQVRFEDATRSLDRSDAPLIEIAFDLGYSDPAHFTRAFRRWAGITPSAYRRAHRIHLAP